MNALPSRVSRQFLAAGWGCFLASLLNVGAAGAGDIAQVTVHAGQPAHPIPSTLWGIFFEEINGAGDGGIYAERVRNRSFEEADKTNFWQSIQSASASGSMIADTGSPLSARNLNSLRLTYSGGLGEIGVANGGWWGMNLDQGKTYDLSFYARCSTGFSGALIARLESANGSQSYAGGRVNGLTTEWQRFTVPLVAGATDPHGRLALVLAEPGTVWLDMV